MCARSTGTRHDALEQNKFYKISLPHSEICFSHLHARNRRVLKTACCNAFYFADQGCEQTTTTQSVAHAPIPGNTANPHPIHISHYTCPTKALEKCSKSSLFQHCKTTTHLPQRLEIHLIHSLHTLVRCAHLTSHPKIAILCSHPQVTHCRTIRETLYLFCTVLHSVRRAAAPLICLFSTRFFPFQTCFANSL